MTASEQADYHIEKAVDYLALSLHPHNTKRDRDIARGQVHATLAQVFESRAARRAQAK